MSSQLHTWGKTSPFSFSSTFLQSRLSIPQLCPGLHTPKTRLELDHMEACLTSAQSLCAISFPGLTRSSGFNHAEEEGR